MRILKNKRGAELTMNTIIIAVLVMIILIVLVLIFSKSARNFFLGTSDCKAKSGECRDQCETGETNQFAGNPSCSQGTICCVKESTLLGTEENP